ncbi:MAG: DUF6116 family protein [Silanimonas sp.]
MRSFLIGPLLQFAAKLRFKWLFLGTLALFVITLLTPDLIPFADEILFGLATLVLSQWKQRGEPVVAAPAAKPGPDVIDLPPDQVRREG